MSEDEFFEELDLLALAIAVGVVRNTAVRP